jgi:hypothetical protein
MEMQSLAIFTAGIILAASPLAAAGKSSPWKDGYGAERSPTIPKKVRKFVIDAQMCTHFSGELSGEDSPRERDVRKKIEKNCKDLDIKHVKLKTRYKGNAEVEAILAEVYEPFL